MLVTNADNHGLDFQLNKTNNYKSVLAASNSERGKVLTNYPQSEKTNQSTELE
jgi:hypothetical protein